MPSLLEPRRQVGQARWAVIHDGYVYGVSTGRVDDLVAAMGGSYVFKSEVSRICQELDSELAAIRDRHPGDARYPYVWFNATYAKVREGGRIVSQAEVIAVGIRASGEKCVLGVATEAGESEAFWTESCRSLLVRGPAGVKWVISDSHPGLKKALASCFAGASSQRCKVHSCGTR